MTIPKNIIKLYTNYLSNKYDSKLSTLDITPSIKGVQKFRKNKFRVQLSYKGNMYSLGIFDNRITAGKKYTLVDKLLNDNTFHGGKIQFQECNTNKDCDDLNIEKNDDEEVICNQNTNTCEKVKNIEKYIEDNMIHEESEDDTVEEIPPEELTEDDINTQANLYEAEQNAEELSKESEKNKKKINKKCPKGKKKSSSGKTCRKNLPKCPKGSRRSKSGKTCRKKLSKCPTGSRRSKSDKCKKY